MQMRPREPRALDRRAFLRVVALTAASTAAVACGASRTTSQPRSTSTRAPTSTTQGAAAPAATAPSSSTPPTSSGPVATASSVAHLPTPGTSAGIRQVSGISYSGKLSESPQLAALVKSGKLDPVEKRLPEHPYVVPHEWVRQGRYGGTMHWMCLDSSDWGTTHLVQESMYGHSPVRWLRDATEIGPGLAESWEANEDQSVWTFHFRKGLRWSDGAPWSVDDIMFWYEDEVLNKDLNPTGGMVPELTSGKGTPVKMRKVDDVTLELRYDSPTPLAIEYAATWVKRGQGPYWMDPKHYLKQFHIRYNRKLNPKKWAQTFTDHQDWTTNPDNPTMTGWKLREYKQGQYSTWERNPYYWCIDRWGNQLPYIDGIVMTNVQDPQVMRLQIQQGKVDYMNGNFTGLSLADVSSLKRSQSRSGVEVRYWDGGGGSVGGYLFNYDYEDPAVRRLIRTPGFLEALSHGFNRANVRKAVYFNQGQLTTGTLSPKAIEFHVGAGPKIYEQWRTNAFSYDPDRAKRMLDGIGVKDTNGDGWRETPDGRPLRLRLDYPSNAAPAFVSGAQLIAKDWQKIGINVSPNPMTPTSYPDEWAAGKAMTSITRNGADAPSILSYDHMVVPTDTGYWAPLEGMWYFMRGTPQIREQLSLSPWKRTPPRMEPEKGGFVDQLWKLNDAAKVELDPMKRHRMVWQMIRLHIKYGPVLTGSIANEPQLQLVRRGLRNVPRREDLAQQGYVDPWVHPVPAVYDPEAWYWDDPEQHS